MDDAGSDLGRRKTVKMRVFTDGNDKMNRSLADVGRRLAHRLAVHALAATAARATARSFTGAARPETAIPLV
ncbi:MAG: D-aminoacyl-tRNA deacylase [Butyricicoccaceae bacterium]